MGAAFKQFFQAIFVILSATEKGAKALDELATWSQEAAEQFNKEARIERKKRLELLEQGKNPDNAISAD